MDAPTSSDIRLDDDGPAVGEEAEQERRNVANAPWLIDHDGKVLPVTNLFRHGETCFDPVLATACVCYDESLTDGRWVCINNLNPGDVWSKVP